MSARLLIVHHTPSPNVQELLTAMVAGAKQPELAEVEVAVEPALSATVSDVLAANGYAMLTPTNIGYMSGALKHFFDTIYYPCLEATIGRPWGLVVHGNNNTAGALRSVTQVADALQWKAVAEPLSVVGEPSAQERVAAGDISATVAATCLE